MKILYMMRKLLTTWELSDCFAFIKDATCGPNSALTEISGSFAIDFGGKKTGLLSEDFNPVLRKI